MACYMAMGGGGGGGGDGGGCAQGWFSNFDFRFSIFVFRALAHCLIYAAVAALATLAARAQCTQPLNGDTGQ